MAASNIIKLNLEQTLIGFVLFDDRLAELLLEKETLSLPDIVDTLGDRPYPIKESVIEYLQELRARESQSVEMAEQERQAEEKRKAAVEATKFDPDAEDAKEGEDEEVDAAVKADQPAETQDEGSKKDEASAESGDSKEEKPASSGDDKTEDKSKDD